MNYGNHDAAPWLVALVESSDDAIISKDLNGVIRIWNAGAQRLFGFTSEEAVGQPITMLVPPELRGEENRILERLLQGERIDHLKTKRLTKNGSRVQVSFTVFPVRDSRGHIIGASTIARDTSERQRAEQGLRESELSGHLLRMQDEERRRIARELHDDLGQLLAAIGMNVGRVMKEKAKLSPAAARSVEENACLVDQALTEIRTLSYLLHPPMLDELGLSSALKSYAAGFAERSKINVDLQLDSDLGPLPKDHELCLFRIAQECLTNVHRHSGSPKATLRLARTSNGIELEIKDEGRGLDKHIQAKLASGDSVGVGFRGMQERVRQIGGTLTVQSNGHGTCVMVALPTVQKVPPPDEGMAPAEDHYDPGNARKNSGLALAKTRC